MTIRADNAEHATWKNGNQYYFYQISKNAQLI
jgi:YHS domain-containing protein